MVFVLSIAAFLTGCSYLVAMYYDHQKWKYLLKPGTMVWIILLAITHLPSSDPNGWWILIGLLFSIAGDIFLMLPHRFLHGLVAFFLAHLCYIISFPFQWKLAIALSTMIALGLISFWFYRLLLPGVRKQGGQKLSLAVLMYIAVISTMLWKALLTGIPLLIAAAILFYLSDAILAWNRFVTTSTWGKYVVISTYYTAQFLFALSLGVL